MVTLEKTGMLIFSYLSRRAREGNKVATSEEFRGVHCSYTEIEWQSSWVMSYSGSSCLETRTGSVSQYKTADRMHTFRRLELHGRARKMSRRVMGDNKKCFLAREVEVCTDFHTRQIAGSARGTCPPPKNGAPRKFLYECRCEGDTTTRVGLEAG